jgi:hypothetical protein
MKVALYIGSHEKDVWQVRLGWFVTRLVQKGTYSNVTHVEAILEENPDGTVTIASSTLRKENSGQVGVRTKQNVTLTPDHWLVIDKPEWDVEKAKKWFKEHDGEPYDVRGAFACWLPILWSNKGRWFCNQAVGASVGLNCPEIFTPSQFSSIAVS